MVWYVYQQIKITGVDDEELLPTVYRLEQNYPNPFNPSTKISWQSPVSGYQTIKLFDVFGREIETIVDGYYEAGFHSALHCALCILHCQVESISINLKSQIPK